ncbi:MAG: hypothetical protein KDD70_16305, partial [Bdellovibrionales bacterium]|nr:hypothetical protein [Bdellovibrionales bacterium]
MGLDGPKYTNDEVVELMKQAEPDAPASLVETAITSSGPEVDDLRNRMHSRHEVIESIIHRINVALRCDEYGPAGGAPLSEELALEISTLAREVFRFVEKLEDLAQDGLKEGLHPYELTDIDNQATHAYSQVHAGQDLAKGICERLIDRSERMKHVLEEFQHIRDISDELFEEITCGSKFLELQNGEEFQVGDILIEKNERSLVLSISEASDRSIAKVVTFTGAGEEPKTSEGDLKELCRDSPFPIVERGIHSRLILGFEVGFAGRGTPWKEISAGDTLYADFDYSDHYTNSQILFRGSPFTNAKGAERLPIVELAAHKKIGKIAES